MKDLVVRFCVAVVNVVLGVHGVTLLTPSADFPFLSEFICNGDSVTFTCRTDGSGIIWSYNGSRISFPSVSGDLVQTFPGSGGAYSALLLNDNSMLMSVLVFLSATDGSSLSVDCLGDVTNSSNVTIIKSGEVPILVTPDSDYTMENNVITISWNHLSLTERFEVMLDGKLHAIVHGLANTTLIQLPECRQYVIHIVAVDFCKNTNPSESIVARCLPSSVTPSVPTSSCPINRDLEIVAINFGTFILVIIIIVFVIGWVICRKLGFCYKVRFRLKRGLNSLKQNQPEKKSENVARQESVSTMETGTRMDRTTFPTSSLSRGAHEVSIPVNKATMVESTSSSNSMTTHPGDDSGFKPLPTSEDVSDVNSCSCPCGGSQGLQAFSSTHN